MVKKIIHASDIHIRNVKRHDEYQEQFDRFINEARTIVDGNYSYNEVRIVLAGDLFHQKIQTSNEQTTLFSWFIRELETICPVVIICGNHDFMESNIERLDTITPIIKLMNLPNVKYVDMILNYKSGCLVDDNLVWCLYSIFDGYSKPDVSIERINNPDKKFIGLFHGPLTGAKTDTGYEFEHGVSVGIFDGCDVVLCGDIHKRGVIEFDSEISVGGVKETRMAVYSGSLIQQDQGESVSSHGFLLWDVETLEYEEFDIANDYGFYKFKVDSMDDINNGLEEFINF